MDATVQELSTFRPKELQKRKRTKRQRSQSLSHLPPVVSEKDTIRENDTCNEEEDMANCLMLLARGGQQLIKEPQGDGDGEDDGHHRNEPKFSSKRYVEEAGYFVYQCKTCDKSFPSFQALGGHRASHKKPKNAVSDEKRSPSIEFPNTATNNNNNIGGLSDDEDVLSLQLMMHHATAQKQLAAKVHECSLCGAEFSSGQALGGHMRRHRSPPIASSSSLTPPTPEFEEPARNKFGSSVLDLDLNLPAPEDDQDSGHGLPFGSSVPDRSNLMLSIPALVDCHY